MTRDLTNSCELPVVKSRTEYFFTIKTVIISDTLILKWIPFSILIYCTSNASGEVSYLDDVFLGTDIKKDDVE